MTLLRELAERARAISVSKIEPLALETAGLAILDTVGVTLVGARTDTVACLARALGGSLASGPATLFGWQLRTDVLNAALINGTAAHALDYDDCNNTMGGHPSAPVLPGLWALAERQHASGGALLAAYIAGVEVETKLGRAVNFDHYEKGWHPTATLGVFGAAAACAHLLQLDDERFTMALALAASMASGVKANFGTMAKPYHVGHATRNGLLAALMAAEGMTASDTALDHPQGFFNVYNGEGTYHPAALLDRWAAPLDLVDPGIAFKRHPCCGSTHPAVDAMLVLRERGLRPPDATLIECWTHPRRLRHTNRPNPTSGLDAKFSVQYVLARALMHGAVRLDHFTDTAIGEAEVRSLMQRIKAKPDPGARRDTGEHFYARVRIHLSNGEVIEAYVDRPVGRDRDHPLPDGALEDKFLDCATQVCDRSSSKQLLARLRALDVVEDVASLSSLLSGNANPLPA